jgi:hypothetical protein
LARRAAGGAYSGACRGDVSCRTFKAGLLLSGLRP